MRSLGTYSVKLLLLEYQTEKISEILAFSRETFSLHGVYIFEGMGEKSICCQNIQDLRTYFTNNVFCCIWLSIINHD